MKSTTIPIESHVATIFDIVISSGYEIYLVGGTVRDFILERPTKDYDFASSATPKELKAIFKQYSYKIMNYGEQHGTISLYKKGIIYEITTFREEEGYSDGRRPDKVVFIKSLETDLSRRDFTINALAADKNGNIIDYHHGIEDFQLRKIRAVGDPYKRFEEDSLRVLRAIRFALKLDFTIEKNTFEAMTEQSVLLKTHSVSGERILQELNGIFHYTSKCFKILADTNLLDILFPSISELQQKTQLLYTAQKAVNLENKEISWLLAGFYSVPNAKLNKKSAISKTISKIFTSYPGSGSYFVELIITIIQAYDQTCTILMGNTRRQLYRWFQYSPSKLPTKPQYDADQFFLLLTNFVYLTRFHSSRDNEQELLHIQKMTGKIIEFISLQKNGNRLEDIKVDGNYIKSLGFKSQTISAVITEIRRHVWQENMDQQKSNTIKIDNSQIDVLVRKWKESEVINISKLRSFISDNKPVFSRFEDHELAEIFQNHLTIKLTDENTITCVVIQNEFKWFEQLIQHMQKKYSFELLQNTKETDELDGSVYRIKAVT